MSTSPSTSPETVGAGCGPDIHCGFSIEKLRGEFPALHQSVHGKPLVYLDNAATTQRPRQVIEAVNRFYREDNANVHRGVHLLSERATQSYEMVREKVRHILGAASAREIIFTQGTTESINLVAHSWGLTNLREGDEVLITGMEHHSNIVPWQIACQRTGANLVVAPINDAGELDLEAYEKALNPKTKLVAATHMSNALGTINPIQVMAKKAHEAGALILVDGAQSAPHLQINVQDLDCDFFAMSGHKIYGPTGVGILYGKEDLLDAMPPFMSGGDMIKSVTFEKTIYNDLPHKFEAGTPNIAGVIGLGAAVDFVEKVCLCNLTHYEADLLRHATEGLSEIPGLRIIGTAKRKASVVSFVIEDIHPHDIGTILDREGVAIRTGHHCAQPVMKRFKVPATARASIGVYNTHEEIDTLVRGLKTVLEMFA